MEERKFDRNSLIKRFPMNLDLTKIIDEDYIPLVSSREYQDSKINDVHKNKAGAKEIIVPASFLPHGLFYKVLGMYDPSQNTVYITHPEELSLEYISTLSHEEGHASGIHNESGAIMYSRSEGHFNKRDFAKKSDFFYFLSV